MVRRKGFIFAMVCFASAQMDEVSHVNELLKEDVPLSGPAVLSRLTPQGTSYVSSVVAAAVAAEIPISVAPNEPSVLKLSSLPALELMRNRVLMFHLPPQFGVSPANSNTLAVELKNINMSMSSEARGLVSNIPIANTLNIRTSKLTMTAHLRMGRNGRGNPQLDVSSCHITPRMPVVVTAARPLPSTTGKDIADAFANHGHEVFEKLLCGRLKHIVEHRINQRFSLLATKISLGEIQKFDLVRSLLRAEERLKRRSRQNRMHGGVSHRIKSVSRHPREATMGATTSEKRRKLHDGSIQRKTRDERAPRKTRQDFRSLKNFDLSRADHLQLDFALVSIPSLSAKGIDITSGGEISAPGQRTPFGPRPLRLPVQPSNDMLQIVVSDFVPNSLMYHGHRTGLFNTRVDPTTPQFGPVMRTTCDLSTGSLFCVGDLFPTLRDSVPDRGIAFLFSTLRAPAVIVKPDGIKFQLLGLLELVATDPDEKIGSMEIHIDASMKMRLTSKHVKGKIILDDIRLISRTPAILVQEELDDASLLSRDILQKMVNDILKQGIPIPVHPLFRLQKPKLTLIDRAMLLETNFELNQHLVRQLTTETLRAI